MPASPSCASQGLFLRFFLFFQWNSRGRMTAEAGKNSGLLRAALLWEQGAERWPSCSLWDTLKDKVAGAKPLCPSPGGLRDAEILTICRERYSKRSPLAPRPAKVIAGGWRRGLWHPGPTSVRSLCFKIIPDSGLEPRRGGGSASRLSPKRACCNATSAGRRAAT